MSLAELILGAVYAEEGPAEVQPQPTAVQLFSPLHRKLVAKGNGPPK